MGIHRDNGYSATVEGFFVYGEKRLRLAMTNSSTFVLASPCELPPGTTGQLILVVDGRAHPREVQLPQGAAGNQAEVGYIVTAPF